MVQGVSQHCARLTTSLDKAGHQKKNRKPLAGASLTVATLPLAQRAVGAIQSAPLTQAADPTQDRTEHDADDQGTADPDEHRKGG